MVANILHRDIFIVEKNESSEYCVTMICPRENDTPIYCTSRAGESPLILLKIGLHYDACVPACACSILPFCETSDFIHQSTNVECTDEVYFSMNVCKYVTADIAGVEGPNMRNAQIFYHGQSPTDFSPEFGESHVSAKEIFKEFHNPVRKSAMGSSEINSCEPDI